MEKISAHKLFLFSVSSIVIASCGGTNYYFDDDTQDLAQCLVGDTWEFVNHGDSLNQMEENITYYDDGTFIEVRKITTYDKLEGFLNNFFLGRDYPAEMHNYSVVMVGGKWKTEDDFLYTVTTKGAFASGDYKQATYNEALSLLESTPEDNSAVYSRGYQYHCDDHHLDYNVWKLTSSSPLTYEKTVYENYENGLPGSINTSTVTLNGDGTGSTYLEVDYVNHKAEEETYIKSTVGLYQYVASTFDESPSIYYKICTNGDTDNCTQASFGNTSYVDRGTALASGTNSGEDYYRR